MNDKPSNEEAQNVTELPKPRKPFAWKKFAKYAAVGTTAVLGAVVIYKLASAPSEPTEIDVFEPAPELDESVPA